MVHGAAAATKPRAQALCCALAQKWGARRAEWVVPLWVRCAGCKRARGLLLLCSLLLEKGGVAAAAEANLLAPAGRPQPSSLRASLLLLEFATRTSCAPSCESLVAK